MRVESPIPVSQATEPMLQLESDREEDTEEKKFPHAGIHDSINQWELNSGRGEWRNQGNERKLGTCKRKFWIRQGEETGRKFS